MDDYNIIIWSWLTLLTDHYLDRKKRGLMIISLILFKNNDALSLFKIIDIFIRYLHYNIVSKRKIWIVRKYWLFQFYNKSFLIIILSVQRLKINLEWKIKKLKSIIFNLLKKILLYPGTIIHIVKLHRIYCYLGEW